jgi:hypothetical protein
MNVLARSRVPAEAAVDVGAGSKDTRDGRVCQGKVGDGGHDLLLVLLN